jgi:hypothetical protein
VVWGSGFDAADLCAEAGEFFVDLFVASINVVEAVDFGFAFCAAVKSVCSFVRTIRPSTRAAEYSP